MPVSSPRLARRSRTALLCAAERGPRVPSSRTGADGVRAMSGTTRGSEPQPASRASDTSGIAARHRLITRQNPYRLALAEVRFRRAYARLLGGTRQRVALLPCHRVVGL